MHAESRKPVDFAAERLCIALSVNPNCGIRAESKHELVLSELRGFHRSSVPRDFLFYVSGGKLLAVTAASWLLYGIYEYPMHFRVLCTGECNIRVDLLLLYPLLALLTVMGVVRFCRSRFFSETD